MVNTFTDCTEVKNDTVGIYECFRGIECMIQLIIALTKGGIHLKVWLGS